MFHKPTELELVIGTVFKYLPLWLIPVFHLLPTRGVKRLKIFKDTAMKVALSIVQRETHAQTMGLPLGNDIMSILGEQSMNCLRQFSMTSGWRAVRANRSGVPKSKLTDKELLSQMMAVRRLGCHPHLSLKRFLCRC